MIAVNRATGPSICSDVSLKFANRNILRSSEQIRNNNSLSTALSSSSSTSSLQKLPISQTGSISNPLYSFLPHNQNPRNIVDIICSNLKNDTTQLGLVQKDIQGLLPHLGTNEISRVLLRCQSDAAAALIFFNWVTSDLGLKPSIHNYCLVVHILSWCKKFPQAMKLLSELVRLNKDVDVFESLVLCTDECNWDPVVFDMLVKAYVKVGMIQQGLRAFKQMEKLGFLPSVVVCNFILDGLSKSNRVDECWKIYEDMGRIGIRPNSITFNILTHLFCKTGDVEKVNEFLEKMEEEGFEPDIVTYNMLVDSYCKKGRLKDAFYLYKIMCRRNVMHDLITYTSLMNGLCKQGQVREAHQLFHRMVHRGLTPDIVTYNTLICGYCKEGLVQESRVLLLDMIGNGIYPDDFTCWVLVQEYGKEGKLLSALNLIIDLQKFGVSVCRAIYDYLIVALCRENRPCAAKNLLERMPSHEPKGEIYNEIICSLCKNNFLEEALHLKSEMVAKDKNPNLSIYKALIGCLCSLSRSAEGEDLFREMVDSGINPDAEVFRSLISGFCKERNTERAENLITEEFQLYDIECFNAVLKVFCEAGDAAKVMKLQDKMLKVGIAPNRLTFKYIVQGLSRAASLEKCL